GQPVALLRLRSPGVGLWSRWGAPPDRWSGLDRTHRRLRGGAHVTVWLAVVAWVGVVLLSGRPGVPDERWPRGPGVGETAGEARPTTPAVQAVLCLLAGGGLGLVVGGPGPGATVWGAAIAAGAWWLMRRGPRVAERRADRAVAADLPFLVLLLAAGLRS